MQDFYYNNRLFFKCGISTFTVAKDLNSSCQYFPVARHWLRQGWKRRSLVQNKSWTRPQNSSDPIKRPLHSAGSRVVRRTRKIWKLTGSNVDREENSVLGGELMC